MWSHPVVSLPGGFQHSACAVHRSWLGMIYSYDVNSLAERKSVRNAFIIIACLGFTAVCVDSSVISFPCSMLPVWLPLCQRVMMFRYKRSPKGQAEIAVGDIYFFLLLFVVVVDSI